MSQAPSVAFATNREDNLAGASANVSLRGTTRGLEILISGAPSTAALGARLTELLAEAPSFFAGSSARVAIDGALPSGALGCLEEVAARFEVQIVEIGPVVARRRRLDVPAVLRPEDVPLVHIAEGTGPIAEEAAGLRGGTPATHAAPSALPVDVAPGEVVTGNHASSDAAPVEAAPPDAAPTEIALANTAPINVAATFVAPITETSVAAAPSDVASSAAAPSDATPAGAAPSDATPSAATSVTAAPSDAAPVTAAPSDAASVTAAASAIAAAAASAAAPANAAPASAAPTSAQLDALASVAAAITAQRAGDVPPGPRLVIGPVRSGVIVDHVGHVIVIGDVNPGAEVRAEGSIIVLGRLRGVAHAAIGRQAGFIIALSLQPQQLRIGRMVARAADADRPGDGAEIAYATGETIVVERFLGRLPSGLAASM